MTHKVDVSDLAISALRLRAEAAERSKTKLDADWRHFTECETPSEALEKLNTQENTILDLRTRAEAAEREREELSVKVTCFRRDREELLATIARQSEQIAVAVNALECAVALIGGELGRDWADHYGADYDIITNALAALRSPAPADKGGA